MGEQANVLSAGNQVYMRTAPKPEGPWTADVLAYSPTLLEANGYAYAAVAHPYLDSTGKTLTISYTNSPNVIQVIKVNFTK